MKKMTRMLAGALALVSVVTMGTACNSNNAPAASDSNANSSANSSSTETSAPAETMATNEGVQSAVNDKADAVDESYKNIKVDTKIKWMAWWDIQEASPAVEMFKALYGTPAGKPAGYEDVADENVFVNISSGQYADRYSKLATAVASDDSPDCFPFEICNYPYSIYINLFQTVDGILDFETDDWADYKETIDQFYYNGHNYCPIMDLGIADMLWYRKSVVEQAGLDDPWELFQKGEWTWSTFEAMCKRFADPESKKWALDGWNPENSLVATTGVPLVGLKDGLLVSNLNDGSIEKVMDLIRKFDVTQEALRYPRESENSWNISYSDWAKGNTLFMAEGSWRYEDTNSGWFKFKKKNKWEDDEVQFVPYPKMDGSDKYYQLMKQDSIMLVAGAKNIDGYKAWIYANLLAAKDPDIKEAGRQQSIENYDWTEELLDRLEICKDPETFTAVFDFKNGIGVDIADTSNGQMPVERLTKDPYMLGATYTSVRAEVQGIIEGRIDEMNKKVS